MADDDLLASAVDELYAADPEAFMDRRTELVKQAKAATAPDGAAAAKKIAALRKPTRSAYAINRLARDDPAAVGRLLDLGERWRAAEQSVDATQIRELTRQRRRLVDELARAAFAAAGDINPSSAVRDEVVATLTAVLSDEAVAADVERGVLVKPARWEGFGFGGPELTLVAGGNTDATGSPATGAPKERPGRERPSANATAGRTRLTPAERRAAREAEQRAEAERAEQAERAAAQAREAAVAEARQAVDGAEENLILATDEEQARVDRVHELEQQIADARRAVDDARREVRRAEIAQRRAQDALRRLEAGRP